MPYSFLVFPVLHTPRLRLRKLDVDDFPALVRYANNRNVADWVINIPHPYQEANAVHRISYVVTGFKEKSRVVFAIEHRDRAELIGEISLHLDRQQNISEIGYWLGEPFWGNGFATEAIAAVLDFGFNRLELDTIYGTCHTANAASEKVLIKNGMTCTSVQGNVSVFQKSAPKSSETLD